MMPAVLVTVPVKPPDGVIVKTNDPVSPRLIVKDEMEPSGPLNVKPGGGTVPWADARGPRTMATTAAARPRAWRLGAGTIFWTRHLENPAMLRSKDIDVSR